MRMERRIHGSEEFWKARAIGDWKPSWERASSTRGIFRQTHPPANIFELFCFYQSGFSRVQQRSSYKFVIPVFINSRTILGSAPTLDRLPRVHAKWHCHIIDGLAIGSEMLNVQRHCNIIYLLTVTAAQMLNFANDFRDGRHLLRCLLLMRSRN